MTGLGLKKNCDRMIPAIDYGPGFDEDAVAATVPA